MINSTFIILFSSLFFFNDKSTTEIYTLSLHDALPILRSRIYPRNLTPKGEYARRALIKILDLADEFQKDFSLTAGEKYGENEPDRKSTRLNSSHLGISYAVFCLKKKKITQSIRITKKI